MKNHYIITDPNQLDRLHTRDSFEFVCKVCRKHVVIKCFVLSYLEKYKMMMCGPCRSSYIQKHMTLEEKIAKLERTRQTKIKLYGDANYNNREKSAQTCLAKFGSTSPLGNKDIYNETCKTRLEKYGTENYVETDTFKTQKEKTQLERYGDATYTNREKAAKTNMERYGVENPGSLNTAKMIETRKNNHGSTSVTCRYFYYGLRFDSAWELAVWIYCIDHGIPISRSTCVFEFIDFYGKNKTYNPDFIICGKLIEIKGPQFWKEDGSMRFPYNKLHRDSDPMTLEEKAYYDDLYERKHQCGLSHGVEFWKSSDCQKYIEYCNLNHPGWQVFFRRDNPLNPSYWCSNILNPGHYQPQYYIPLSRNGITPTDINESEKYHFLSDKGVTPFDIPKQ